MAKFYKHLRSTRIKTGIWTLVIVLILIFGYLWLTNSLNMRSQQNLQVLFSNVMGLEIGDKIMFRGMEVGRVKSVTLHDQGILVSGNISTNIKIPKGSRFYIEDSIMGSKSLNILPANTEEYLDLNLAQHGDDPSGMMDVIAKASDFITELDEILQRLKAEDGILDQGQKLLANASSTMHTADLSITEIKSDISTTIGRVDSLTMMVESFVSSASEPLLESITLAPATLERMNSALDSLSVLSGKLNVSAGALAQGEGTAGKILHEDDLYERVLQSIDRLDQLIADIRANPRKYIKFSVF